MKGFVHTNRTNRSRPSVYNQLDTHRWATKIEIHRILSGKPDLKIKDEPKTRSKSAAGSVYSL